MNASAERELRDELHRLEEAARGGRVAHTGFLEPGASARLVHDLAGRAVSARAWGGYPGARRRVVTAFPSHVPEAGTELTAVYLDGALETAEIRPLLVTAGIAGEQLGDLVPHQEGVSVITLDPPPAGLLELTSLAGREVAPRAVPLSRTAAGSVRQMTVVVPSLRVDVVGAKGFRVSRSYFAKGVAGGKVSVNGTRVGKAGSAEAGDEIYAEGLGRLRVLGVDGETRRGNVKLSLEVEAGG